MSAIKKVALAGATGNLGPAILKELVDAGFEVTVLTRSSSSNKFPANVAVKAVDYDSLDSLTDALKGQDALVSTLASLALSTQLLLAEAAVKAGVQRFIPSEFGSNTTHEKTSKLPVFGDKVVVQNALKKYAAEGALSYTLINNGPFLDWGLMVGFIQNPGKKQATIYDGGDRTFSTTSLPTIGKAVVGVLRHLKETANRVVYIQDTALTQNELLAHSQKVTGGADGWTVNPVSINEELDSAFTDLKTPGKPFPAMKFINASIWGDGYGSHFSKLDNELLGLPQLSDDQLHAIIRQYVK